MRDRRQLLKIKLKSLAAEAKIIRRAEQRLALPRTVPVENGVPVIPNKFTKADRDANPEMIKVAAQNIRQIIRMRRAKARGESWYDENRRELAEMRDHRVLGLRSEARATHLAYGFLRGRTYDQMEGNHLKPPVDTFAYLTEQNLLAKAAKMAAVYGVRGVAKCDIERDFKQWQESRVLRLTVEDGTQRLEAPPATLFSNQPALGVEDDNLPF